MRVISCFGRKYYHTEAKAEKSVAFGQYASFYPNALYNHDIKVVLSLVFLLITECGLLWSFLQRCDVYYPINTKTNE